MFLARNKATQTSPPSAPDVAVLDAVFAAGTLEAPRLCELC
jgi:hypothetical protein